MRSIFMVIFEQHNLTATHCFKKIKIITLPDRYLLTQSPLYILEFYISTDSIKYEVKIFVKVLVTQSCLILCVIPMDYSLSVSPVHGILQAWVLEWIAILFFKGSSWPRDQTWVYCIAGKFFTIWATKENKSQKFPTEKLKFSLPWQLFM